MFPGCLPRPSAATQPPPLPFRRLMVTKPSCLRLGWKARCSCCSSSACFGRASGGSNLGDGRGGGGAGGVRGGVKSSCCLGVGGVPGGEGGTVEGCRHPQAADGLAAGCCGPGFVEPLLRGLSSQSETSDGDSAAWPAAQSRLRTEHRGRARRGSGTAAAEACAARCTAGCSAFADASGIPKGGTTADAPVGTGCAGAGAAASAMQLEAWLAPDLATSDRLGPPTGPDGPGNGPAGGKPAAGRAGSGWCGGNGGRARPNARRSCSTK
mmetsp:Transcript_58643/g.188596  ORF Transcript_58643/g.188596 Transcript_58643/m.188596 type:complete len:267 (-) Transcript_58643:1153-1953(-)